MPQPFPAQIPGRFYLTEGGQETELMYKHGFDLPEFAMFPMLDDPVASERLREMYASYLQTAADSGFGALMGGFDYRASPDWAAKLGYSLEDLAAYQLRGIEFLREASAPFATQLPALLIVGIVGPRGDAYGTGDDITAKAAAAYHATQLKTLAKADVDLVEAMTFNNVPEAIGLARAAAEVDLPVSISFTLDETSRLHSGPSLREAIETIDDATGDARPAFYGINCSHPLEFLPAIEPGDWFERVRCLRPNAAALEKVALCTLGHLEEGDPVDLGRRMGKLAQAYPHIDIWGGCCGTWSTHLGEIARNVLAAHGSPA